MNALNRSTRRRLQQLKQNPSSVWEGDRRQLAGSQNSDWLEPGSAPSTDGDCILWVDGSQGMVRAMDIVTPDTGSEAVVRTLIRAMEHPHNPGMPARPKKDCGARSRTPVFSAGRTPGSRHHPRLHA